MTTPDLFTAVEMPRVAEPIEPGATVLRGYATGHDRDLLAALAEVSAQAPLRTMVTPGGQAMSVAMTNCGALGWVSDRRGYRYTATDPMSARPWPALPRVIAELARAAACAAGYTAFEPDACLVNQYAAGARMSLHQDRNERDFQAPIVSVSLGLPSVFLWGGARRADRARRIPLAHGDVVVWGGPARLRFHGVAPLKPGLHPLTGEARLNFTLRRAG